jgi:hypothetical protein
MKSTTYLNFTVHDERHVETVVRTDLAILNKGWLWKVQTIAVLKKHRTHWFGELMIKADGWAILGGTFASKHGSVHGRILSVDHGSDVPGCCIFIELHTTKDQMVLGDSGVIVIDMPGKLEHVTRLPVSGNSILLKLPAS